MAARVRQCIQMDREMQQRISARLAELQRMGMDIKYSQFVRDCVAYCLRSGKPHDQQYDLPFGKQDVVDVNSLLSRR